MTPIDTLPAGVVNSRLRAFLFSAWRQPEQMFQSGIGPASESLELAMTAIALVEPAHGPSITGSPLLDRLWHAARSRGDSAPTADFLAVWARRFILFHDKRHPGEMGLAQVTHFLEHVAKTEREPLQALAQARAALALLYERVVGAALGELHGRGRRACSINCVCCCA
jgi:hypothetical protein